MIGQSPIRHGHAAVASARGTGFATSHITRLVVWFSLFPFIILWTVVLVFIEIIDNGTLENCWTKGGLAGWELDIQMFLGGFGLKRWKNGTGNSEILQESLSLQRSFFQNVMGKDRLQNTLVGTNIYPPLSQGTFWVDDFPFPGLVGYGPYNPGGYIPTLAPGFFPWFLFNLETCPEAGHTFHGKRVTMVVKITSLNHHNTVIPIIDYHRVLWFICIVIILLFISIVP